MICLARRSFQRFRTAGFACLLLLSWLSCSDPTSPDYINPHDPSSDSFRPTAPSRLAISAPTETGRHLTWQDNSHFEAHYLIQRKLGLDGLYEDLGIIAGNTTSFDDTSVIHTDTTYVYRVAGVSARGATGIMDSLIFRLPFPPPSGLMIHSNSPSSATLRWTDNSDFEEEFVLEKRDASASYEELARTPSNVPLLADDQLDSTLDYHYRVRAVTRYNNSRNSNEIRAAYFPSAAIRQTTAWLYGTRFYEPSRDGHYLLVAGYLLGNDGGSFIVYDILAKRASRGKHGGTIQWITMSADDRLVATFSDDGYVRIWNTLDLSLYQAIPAVLGVTQAAFSEDGSLLICACTDQAIRCLSISTGRILYTIPARPQPIASIAVSPDGIRFTCANGGRIEVFNVVTGMRLHAFPALPAPVSLVRYSPNNILAALSGGNRIDMWDGATRTLVQTITGFSTTRSALTFTDDGRFVIACVNSVLAIWRVSDRQLMRSWPCEASLYRDLPDVLFTVSQHNIVASFEARKGDALDLYPFSLQWDALEN